MLEYRDESQKLSVFGKWALVVAGLLSTTVFLAYYFVGPSGPPGDIVAGRTPASRLDLATGTDSAVALAGGACSSPNRTKAKELIANHPNWDIVDIARILCGEVAVGMTSPQVRLSLGSPPAISGPNLFGPTNGDWWYGQHGVKFKEGIVTTLLDSARLRRSQTTPIDEL
jgi:hypothetical protein